MEGFAVQNGSTRSQRVSKRARQEQEETAPVGGSGQGQSRKRACVEEPKEQTPPSSTSPASDSSISPQQPYSKPYKDRLLEIQMGWHDNATREEKTYLKNPKDNPNYRANKKAEKKQRQAEAEAAKAAREAKAKAGVEVQAARRAEAAAKTEASAAREGAEEEMPEATIIENVTSPGSQAASTTTSTPPTSLETTPELVSSPLTSLTSSSINENEDGDADFEWEDALSPQPAAVTGAERPVAWPSTPAVDKKTVPGSSPESKTTPVAKSTPAKESAATVEAAQKPDSIGMKMGAAEKVIIDLTDVDD
jgi:hypothetical protein